MKRIAIAATAVAVLAFSPAAVASGTITGRYKAKVTSAALGGAVKGTWTLNFKKSGSVTITDNANVVGHSTFSVTGAKIKLGPGAGCSGSGTYKFKLTGKKLKFRLLKDACAGRKIVLSSTFRKVG
jgi:hypothetical protein